MTANSIRTKEQRAAEAAYCCVAERKRAGKSSFDEYITFALDFPALIHSCGLVQALSFAQAKGKTDYIADISDVFHKLNDEKVDLLEKSRSAPLLEYTRITRRALQAATWLKRYCQANDTRQTDEGQAAEK